MTFDFPLVLLSVIVFSGVVTLCDFVYCLAKREPLFEAKKRPMVIEYSRSFFPVLLLVFVIRSFIVQPYRVPTSSLAPTVLPGDFILVNQYHYGLRFPIWDIQLFPVGHPQHGQIALFYYPVDHAITFVKRVIGVPGDHISYINKTLYINNQKQPIAFVGNVTRLSDFGQMVTYQDYQENFMGVKHDIFMRSDMPSRDFYDLIVPPGKYFMMGDNRDDSDDSRFWGFVDERGFIGHALLVWMSWNANAAHWYQYIQWGRIGNQL